MADLYGVNHTKAFQSEPSTKVNANEMGGVKRHHYDSYTFSAVLSIGDKIYLGKLPKGARVIGGRLQIPVDSGAIGIVKVGWDAGTNSGETADDDGFWTVAEGDFGAGAIDAVMAATAAGFRKEFADEVNVVVECTEASTGDADTLELELEYVLN